MTEAIQISKQAARRFVLGKQGLWPGRRGAGKPGAHAAMVACEHLQLDPLVIVARSHDLMLHSRVAGYEPRFFDELTYGERLFFDWGGWLAVRPMAELPYWRSLMLRDRENPRMQMIADHHRAVIAEMRDALREKGTLSNRDFGASDRVAVDSYRGRKDSAIALYYLWRTGEAMTHHRNGFERVYALTEVVAPAPLIAPARDEDADRFMARKAIAFAGIGPLALLRGVFAHDVNKRDLRAIERELVESEELVPVKVENWKGSQFVLARDVDLLGEVASARVPKAWAPIGATTEDAVTLLSPLDPVLGRRRAKILFDFEYLWEIYKQQELVQFGRYAMPILWGERLAGRIDPKLDRRSNTLVVNGIWLEDATDARHPEFLDALREGTRSLMAFLGADHVDATAVTNARLRRPIASLNTKRRRRP